MWKAAIKDTKDLLMVNRLRRLDTFWPAAEEIWLKILLVTSEVELSCCTDCCDDTNGVSQMMNK